MLLIFGHNKNHMLTKAQKTYTGIFIKLVTRDKINWEMHLNILLLGLFYQLVDNLGTLFIIQ